MVETMTPSIITDGQIEKATDIFRATLRKHRTEINSDAAQQVLGVSELGQELFKMFHKRVEAVSNMIVRRVRVNRIRSAQGALAATGRKQYVADRVISAMPRGEGEEVDVYFFKLDFSERDYISDDKLEKEFKLRGLTPDPYALAAANEADPAFADTHPNGTHWKDVDGKWCYSAFRCWNDERFVSVHRRDGSWDVRWWFAGVRK